MEVTQSPASSRTEFGRHLLRYAPAVVLPAVFSLCFTAVFTRVFAAEQYGSYVVVLSVATATSVIVSSWLQQGITRYLPGITDEREVRTLKGAFAVCSVVIAVGVLALSLATLPFTITAHGDEWRGLMWPAYCFTLLNALYLPLMSLLQAELRSGRYSLYAVSSSAIRLVMAFALTYILISKKPGYLVWASVLSVLVLLPSLVSDAQLPSFGWILKQKKAIGASAKRLVAYGVPMMGWIASSAVLDSSDRYVIQIFRGSSEVGIYAANYATIYGAAVAINAPIMYAAHALLMKANNEGRADVAAIWLEHISEWYLCLGTVLVGITYLLSKDIAGLLLGPTFLEGHIIIPVVLAGLVVWQWSMYAHKPLEFEGRSRLLLSMAVGAAVLNVVLNVMFVPRFGYLAAAYTTLMAYAAYGVFAFLVGRRTMPWKIPLKRPARFMSVSIALIGLGQYARTLIEPYAGYVSGLLVVGSTVVLIGIVAAVCYRDVFRQVLSRLGR